MNEYINLTLENIDNEHICCAIGDKKHQVGVDMKKAWIKNKLKDGHVFRKLNDRGKIFIEYEPIETAWVLLLVKIMNIFIACGLREVLKEKVLLKNYSNMQ